LLYFTLDLLRAFTEGLFLQIGDQRPQGLIQQIMGALCGRELRVLRLQEDKMAFRTAGSSGSVRVLSDMGVTTKNQA
jgi:hypothetical protein